MSIEIELRKLINKELDAKGFYSFDGPAMHAEFEDILYDYVMRDEVNSEVRFLLRNDSVCRKEIKELVKQYLKEIFEAK